MTRSPTLSSSRTTPSGPLTLSTSPRRSRSNPASGEAGKVHAEQVADALDREVGGGILRRRPGVERVVALAGEDRRHAAPPDGLDRGEDAELVVHEDVPFGGEALFDVVELLLLVHVDEDVSVHGLEEARAVDLARLEDHVAVGEDDGRSERLRLLDDVERVRVEP